jgi:hypothetical protein
LSERGVYERKHHPALPFAGIRQGVAHEVDTATLPRRVEDSWLVMFSLRRHDRPPVVLSKPTAIQEEY